MSQITPNFLTLFKNHQRSLKPPNPKGPSPEIAKGEIWAILSLHQSYPSANWFLPIICFIVTPWPLALAPGSVCFFWIIFMPRPLFPFYSVIRFLFLCLSLRPQCLFLFSSFFILLIIFMPCPSALASVSATVFKLVCILLPGPSASAALSNWIFHLFLKNLTCIIMRINHFISFSRCS